MINNWGPIRQHSYKVYVKFNIKIIRSYAFLSIEEPHERHKIPFQYTPHSRLYQLMPDTYRPINLYV